MSGDIAGVGLDIKLDIKVRMVPSRFELEVRVSDWEARSGSARVSKVAWIEVGRAVDGIEALAATFFMWNRETPLPGAGVAYVGGACPESR